MHEYCTPFLAHPSVCLSSVTRRPTCCPIKKVQARITKSPLWLPQVLCCWVRKFPLKKVFPKSCYFTAWKWLLQRFWWNRDPSVRSQRHISILIST